MDLTLHYLTFSEFNLHLYENDGSILLPITTGLSGKKTAYRQSIRLMKNESIAFSFCIISILSLLVILRSTEHRVIHLAICFLYISCFSCFIYKASICPCSMFRYASFYVSLSLGLQLQSSNMMDV